MISGHAGGSRVAPAGTAAASANYTRVAAPLRRAPCAWGIPAGWVATSVGRKLELPVIVTADSGEFVADHEIAYGFQRRWIDRRLIRDTMLRATV